MSNKKQWDILLKGALVFDGSGAAPEYLDVAVANGRIAEKGDDLPQDRAVRTVDASGQWLMPGLLDIHTHFDLEVELDPALPEALRHGTTTAVVSNCSLGLAFGNQQTPDQNPLVDCFARVENIPKHVLEKVADQCDWNDSGAYLEHFDGMALGPNIAPMIPHSMLRTEVMGLAESIQRDPNSQEMDRMCELLEKGMNEGYIGFSTDALPFHYLANDPHRRSKIPTQFGSYGELKRLTSILRRHGRVWQATPPKESIGQILHTFLLTSGRLFKRPLKITAVASLDLHTNKLLSRMGLVLSRLLNSRLVKGHFRFQALSAPFQVWADGPITPLAEEIPELRLLNEPDLEDREARRKLLDDPGYIEQFRHMWFTGKSGFNLASLKRILRIEDLVLNRRLDDMFIAAGPVSEWNGEAMQSVYERVLQWQQTHGRQGARNDTEAEAFARFPIPLQDDCDFFLHLLREYDLNLRWHTTTANRNPEKLKKLLFHPLTLPGFNDSGAHLTNMAFYDCNLRTLKLASEVSEKELARAVRRLTREPAEFFGLDAGTLDIGQQADLVIIDPERLASYTPEECTEYVYRPDFSHHQMVNRVPGVVSRVLVAGKMAWENGDFTPEVGGERFGRVLRDQQFEARTGAAGKLSEAA